MTGSELLRIVLTNWVPSIFPAIAVVFVGIYGARKLEEYRRRQSFAAEIATHRRRAMVWVFRALGKMYLRAQMCVQVEKGSPEYDERKASFVKSGRFALERLHASAFVLLPQEVHDLAIEHARLILETLEESSMTSEEKRERLKSDLRELRTRIQQVFPDLWK
jgi:hypothetical protein